MKIQFSRRLAILYGVALPLLETIRRWNQLADLRVWPFWLDDWCIGAFLLYGAWRAQEMPSGQPWLSGAWGFTVAMGYMSFFSQLASQSQPDPSGAPLLVVLTIKGVGLALAVMALLQALRWKPAP